MDSNNLTNEEALKEKEKGNGSEVENTIETDQLKEVSVEGEEWSTPTKAARSSPKKNNTLEFGMVSILSNSRFSVLSPDEEEGEILVSQENKVENIEEVSVHPTSENSEEVTEKVNVEDPIRTEEYKEEEKAEKEEQVQSHILAPSVKTQDADRVGTRQSLPRESKNNHRFIKNMSVSNLKDAGPPNLNKKKLSKNH